MLLVTLSATAVCFSIGASVRVFAIANLLTVCIFVLMLVGIPHDVSYSIIVVPSD